MVTVNFLVYPGQKYLQVLAIICPMRKSLIFYFYPKNSYVMFKCSLISKINALRWPWWDSKFFWPILGDPFRGGWIGLPICLFSFRIRFFLHMISIFLIFWCRYSDISSFKLLITDNIKVSDIFLNFYQYSIFSGFLTLNQ